MNDPGIGHVRLDWRVARVAAASVVFLAMLPLISRGATAAGGDVSVNFAAAAPYSYTHATGGGAWNDGTNAEDKDIREELEGGQITCADTVTYLTKLDVDSGAADNQVIELDFSFLAATTGQPGAAHADVTSVSINYGEVENGDDGGASGGGPGTFGLDSAIDDDRQNISGGDSGTGGSAASIVSKAFDPTGTTPFNGADELLLTVRIDDLDAGETVVLRIDTTLACDPGSRPTGNLQAKFEAGTVVEIDGQSVNEPLTGGAQTIPLKKIGDLTPEPTPAEIQVEKITVPADLPDGFDFTLSGDDDQTITGLTDQDGPRSFDPVDAGIYTVTETPAAGFSSTASCDNLDTEGDEAASPVDLAVAAEEAWRCTFVNTLIPDLSIDVVKSADPTSVPEPGAPVTFTASVTNPSPESVTITKLTDAIDGGNAFDVTTTGDIVTATTCDDAIDTTLDADGGTYTCTFTLEVSGNAGDVVTDLVEFTVVDDDDTQITEDAPAQVTINDVTPTIEVTKTDDDATVAAPGGDVRYTVVVTNTSVENVTITSITDQIGTGDTLDLTTTGDLVLATTCGDAVGTVIAPGETYSCEFTVAVASNDESSVTDVVRVTADDDDGKEATADDDETTPVTPVADLAIEKTIAEDLAADGTGTYLLTVTNLGPSTGSGVELSDELPDGLTVRAIEEGEWDCADSTATVVSCTLESLAAGSSAAVSVQVDVAPSLSGSTVTNQAEVTGTEPDEDLTNNRDEIDATIPVLVLPTQQLKATPAAPTPAAPAATAPVAASPATQTLAVTGQGSLQLAMLAVVLMITGAALLGFAWGRRASRLDG